ncbi:MAG: hypothetical protein KQJ78_01145 [Deltaproteobacteria bacterium]|nr:hypothetical protein [Deltaproteobacteria bacterium]
MPSAGREKGLKVRSGQNTWPRWVWGLLAAAVALRLGFMAVSLAGLPATTDEAMLVLQAKQVAQGARPLLFLAQPYSFPLEAYLHAPLVGVMPRNAFGARYWEFLLGLASLAGLWWFVRRWGPWREVWPAAVLILFPSTYLLYYQAAYAVPLYGPPLALWTALLLLAQTAERARPWPGVGAALAGGVAAGLALAVHLVSVTLLLPLGVLICLGRDWRSAVARTPAFAAGLALGAAPYWLALWRVPGAYPQLAQRRGLAAIWQLDLSGVTDRLLPGVLGIVPPTFPDFNRNVEVLAWLGPLAAWLALAVLAAATVVALFRFLRRSWAARWPQVDLPLALAGAAWLGLFTFLMNTQSNSNSYRYVLVLVWTLPLLGGWLHGQARGAWRRGLGWLALGWVAANLVVLGCTLAVWLRPDFAAVDAKSPSLAPAIQALERAGIRHCFASYWSSYRLTFLTDERIVCSQPYNQRFWGWPIPYFAAVAADPAAVYVLTTPDQFPAAAFAQDLRQMGVSAATEEAGEYTIFRDFREDPPEGRLLTAGEYRVTASHFNKTAPHLYDGDLVSQWKSRASQVVGMNLVAEFDRPRTVDRVILQYHHYPHDRTAGLRLEAREGEGWRVLLPLVPDQIDPFYLYRGKPIYGEPCQTLVFPPTRTRALRLSVAEPRPRRNWALTELMVEEVPGD